MAGRIAGQRSGWVALGDSGGAAAGGERWGGGTHHLRIGEAEVGDTMNVGSRGEREHNIDRGNPGHKTNFPCFSSACF